MSYWESKTDFTPVTFFRPDGDTEDTYVGWCQDNGFFKVGRDLEFDRELWSGRWYYDYYPEERPKAEAKLCCPVRGCRLKFNSEERKKDHVLTCMGNAHCKYRFEQKLEKEVEDYQKEKEQKRKEGMIKIYKEERSELLDEVYGDCYMGSDIPRARQKLANVELKIAELEGTAVACPVCQRKFLDEDEKDEHLDFSKNEAHRKYWEEIYANDFPPAEEGLIDSDAQAQMAEEKEIPPPKLLPGQTDIRSFFRKTT